jgi:hypothetical protein
MSWRETSAPTTLPFWARCNNPFHLLVLTTFLTQVSLVTIGHRAGRSSAFGLAEAELLSASFRPNGLPSRYACCVALTPLSKRNFYEVISCAVNGRTSPRSGRARLRHPAPQNDRFATISARYAQSSLRVADSASGVPGTGPIGWNSSETVGLTICPISGSLQHEIG